MSTIEHLKFASTVDLPKLLEGHHSQHQARTGEIIHVYAIAGPPVFGDAKENQWNFNIEIPLWGVTFILSGYVDLFSLAIDATFSVKIPIVGSIKLAEVKGNLRDGVTVNFGISGVLSGEARFYVNDRWLYVDLSATVFGTHHGPVTIRLIPLPYVSSSRVPP
ncbi:hypothetical protein C8Q76DRAFT_822774 [Earliella scabrosa]|nr:hypothetical protein C8Q76DRAFT_822774 [Earliella scabrosa]